MTCIIDAQGIVSESLEGPLGPYIVSFATRVLGQGYGLRTLKNKVRIAAFFSRWLEHRTVRLRDVSFEQAVRFLRYGGRETRRGDAASLRQLIEFMRDQGAIPVEKAVASRLTSAERCLAAYEQYLREIRALVPATIIHYVPFVRTFLKHRFGNGRVSLSRLRAVDVVRFVQRQAPRLHLRQAKLLTTVLRSFLRYGRYCGEVRLDLAAAVPLVPNWSMTAIPRGIAPDQVRKLLAHINRRTAVGRRDYAILLLLARLGMRSSEVVLLELDHIDWNTGRLSVQGKGNRRTELPLPADVGKTIVAYVQHGRPRCSSRRVFLRATAPIRGFLGPCAVGCIVRRAIKRAGIDAPTTGAHQFRHGLASEMLRQGSSLSEIGALLGHLHPQTTKIYTKVDLPALRMLALPWPRGTR